jgi:hypothetical protein
VWVNAWPASTSAIVTVTGPGLTLTLNGTSAIKGTLKPNGANYYLACYIPMTLVASGSGTAMFGKEEWSFDGGPYTSYPTTHFAQNLAAGSSMVWPAYVNGAQVATLADVKPVTATAKFHYGVNASFSDYPNGVAQDFVFTQTYTCMP